MGESTEHTAYLRLKDGIEAPRSGSRGVNGRIVSEQIGAEIFIDGWALVSPGRPRAGRSAGGRSGPRQSRRGGGVCCPGDCRHGGSRLFRKGHAEARLTDAAVRFIPVEIVHAARATDEVREWHAREKWDWLQNPRADRGKARICEIRRPRARAFPTLPSFSWRHSMEREFPEIPDDRQYLGMGH